jgi:hypothetical protein
LQHEKLLLKNFWSSNRSMCESIHFLLLISSDFNFGEYIISEILFWRYYFLIH